MKVKSLFIPLSLAMLLLLPAIAGCGTSDKEKVEVRLAMGDYFAHYVLNYAIENDIVTSDTVELNIRYGYSYGHNEELLAEQCPMGEMSVSVFGTLPENDDVDYTAIAVFVTHAGMDEAKGVSMAFVAADSDIQAPADLVGKTIGVTNTQSNTTTVFLGMLKEDYGVTEDQLTFVAKPPALLAQLLLQGGLDAIVLGGDPAIANYYSEDYRVLWNLDHAFYDKYGVYTSPGLLVVNPEYLEENHDIVEEVYDILKASIEYGEAHLEELAQMYAEENGGESEFYQQIYTNHYRITLMPMNQLYEDAMMAVFGYTLERGIINELPDPDTCFEEW